MKSVRIITSLKEKEDRQVCFQGSKNKNNIAIIDDILGYREEGLKELLSEKIRYIDEEKARLLRERRLQSGASVQPNEPSSATSSIYSSPSQAKFSEKLENVMDAADKKFENKKDKVVSSLRDMGVEVTEHKRRDNESQYIDVHLDNGSTIYVRVSDHPARTRIDVSIEKDWKAGTRFIYEQVKQNDWATAENPYWQGDAKLRFSRKENTETEENKNGQDWLLDKNGNRVKDNRPVKPIVEESTKAVILDTAEKIPTRKDSILKYLKDYLVGKGLSINTPFGKFNVLFRYDGLKHDVWSQRISQKKAQTFTMLPELVQNARYFGEDSVKHDKNNLKTENLYHLISLVKNGNKYDIVRIVLKGTKKGKYVYNHSVYEGSSTEGAVLSRIKAIASQIHVELLNKDSQNISESQADTANFNFSRSKRTDAKIKELDAKHRDLYERYKAGDKKAYEEAVKLVIEEARRKSYKGKGYHGTDKKFTVANPDMKKLVEITNDNGEKTVFSLPKDFGEGFYLSENKDYAGEFGKVLNLLHNMKDSELYGSKGFIDKYRKAWKADIKREFLEKNPDKQEQESDIYPDWIEYLPPDEFVFAMQDLLGDKYRSTLLKHGIRGLKYVYHDNLNYVSFEGGATVKLQDPFTFDDNGNLIPLSKRFDSKNPDMRFSRIENQSVQEKRDYQQKKAREEITSKSGRIIQATTDAFAPLAALERVIYGKIRGAEKSAWKMALMTKNLDQVMFHLLRVGAIKYNKADGSFTTREGTKGLEEILNPIKGKAYKNFEHYAKAKSAFERWAFLRKKKPFAKLSFSDLFGFTIEDAKKWIAEASDTSKKAFDELQIFFQGQRDFMLETELITPEQHAALSKFKNYVPFFREGKDLEKETEEAYERYSEIFPGGKGFSGRSAGIEKFIGSSRKTKNLVENILNQARRTMDSGYKNIAAYRALNLMRKIDMAKYVRSDSVDARVKIAELRRALEAEGIDVGNISDDDLLRKVPVEAYLDLVNDKNDNIVSVRVGGTLRFYKVETLRSKEPSNTSAETSSLERASTISLSRKF